MLGWLVIIASTVLMYRIAEIENLSGLAWGGATFALCLVCSILVPIPFLNIVLGLILSFVAMTIYNAKFGGP